MNENALSYERKLQSNDRAQQTVLENLVIKKVQASVKNRPE